MIFFKRPSLTTKGLKSAILFKDSGRVSKGRIVLEKNKNKLAKLMVAKSEVSCDLKRYPISIPTRVNKETININEKKIGPREETRRY